MTRPTANPLRAAGGRRAERLARAIDAPLHHRCSGPLGIAWDRHRLRVVQIARHRVPGFGRTPVRIARGASVLRPDAGATPAAALRPDDVAVLGELVDRRGMVGPLARLAAPEGQLITASVDLAARDLVEAETRIASEIERLFELAPGSYEVAAWPAPGGTRRDRSQHLLLHALRHTDADAALDASQAGGLDPVAIDSAAWAAAALTGAAGWAGVSLVLHLNADRSLLTLIEDGVIAYERLLMDCGMADAEALLPEAVTPAGYDGDAADDRQRLMRRYVFAPEAQNALPLRVRDAAEHFLGLLTSEAGPVIDYASARDRRRGVRRLAVVGEGAACRGLAGALAERLGVPGAPLLASTDILGLTESGMTGIATPTSKADAHCLDVWAIPAGLALGEGGVGSIARKGAACAA